MLAIVTLIASGEVISAEPFPSGSLGIAAAANHLVLKKLAFGVLARYTVEAFDGSELFSLTESKKCDN